MISKESAEHYQWGHGCDGWHLVKSSNLSVIQERVPSGCGEVRHFHRHADQFFFVLSGRATLEVNGTIHLLGPHQGVHVKARTPHQLVNDHSKDLIFTVTSTPPSHGDRVDLS